MIRATLSLAAVALAGVVAVWWTARHLDPLRVLERITPAQVRTVDLSGSGAFPRARLDEQRPAASRAAPVPEPPRAERAAATPVEEPSEPEAPAQEIVVATVPLKSVGELREGPAESEPEPAPMDPDASALLIRRMLSLYPRAGESE